MADGEWLSPVQLFEFTEEERHEYYENEMQQYMENTKHMQNSEDEDEIVLQGEASDEIIANADDSDAEEMQMPELNAEDEIQSDEEFDAPAPELSDTNYTAKDGTIWSSIPPTARRRRLSHTFESVVRELCFDMFRDSGRTVVCDNMFTSYALATSMMTDCDLSILGTVNKRRRFVPEQFANPRGREVQSTIFGFNENVAICSYVTKKNKSVVLLSTKHCKAETSGPKNKPVMLLDYNASKGGVDNMDKCVTEYSTKRRTTRWPLAFFYNILDIAAYAAYIIYIENNKNLKMSNTTNRRRLFLQQLSKQLVKKEVEKRAANVQIMRNFSTRNAVEGVLGYAVKPTEDPPQQEQERDDTGRIKIKGKCYVCTKRRSTRRSCRVCKKPICVEHSFERIECANCIKL